MIKHIKRLLGVKSERDDDPAYVRAREEFLVARELADKYPGPPDPVMQQVLRNSLLTRGMLLAMLWPDETLRDIDILFPKSSE